MSRRLLAFAVLAALTAVAAIGCGLAAIWTYGPDSGRLAGTSGVLFFVAFFAGLGAMSP